MRNYRFDAAEVRRLNRALQLRALYNRNTTVFRGQFSFSIHEVRLQGPYNLKRFKTDPCRGVIFRGIEIMVPEECLK